MSQLVNNYVCTRCVTYSIFLLLIALHHYVACLSRAAMSHILLYYLLDILFLIFFINLSSSNNCMCGEGGIALVYHGTLFLRLTFGSFCVRSTIVLQ